MPFLFFLALLLSCSQAEPKASNAPEAKHEQPVVKRPKPLYDTTITTIHVFVALADNVWQGIVPVPAKIGNGQDPDHNLYWGCGYGIRSYFKNSSEWTLVKAQKPDTLRLERLVFKNKTKNCYLVADAYDGRYIRNCVHDFLLSACGRLSDTLRVQGKLLGIDGNAGLLAYIGHDGLMEFQLSGSFSNVDGRKRDCIILACTSQYYFEPYLKQTGCYPLVWSSNLMCPEAYTLHDAITGYLRKESPESIRTRAVKAYAKYQKTSEESVRRLLVSGWE